MPWMAGGGPTVLEVGEGTRNGEEYASKRSFRREETERMRRSAAQVRADRFLVVVALLWLFATPYVAAWLSRNTAWSEGGVLRVLAGLAPVVVPVAILRRAYHGRLRWAAATSALGLLLYTATALVPLWIW